MPDPVPRCYLSSDQIDELFQRLRARLREVRCDSSLKETMAWADANRVPRELLQLGLARMGAHCDCQVILRVLRATPRIPFPYGMLL